MKAVCLLVCLALARDSGANIVRHQLQPQMDSLYVQPLSLVDQFQWSDDAKPHRHHQSEETKPDHHHQSEEAKSHHHYQSEEVKPHHHHQSEEAKPHHHHHHHHHHQSESTSHSHESRESKEHYNYDDISEYPSSFRSDNKDWNSPLFSTVITQDQIPYGDVIEWRGVQIAAGPKSPVKNKKDIEKIFKDAYSMVQHVSEEDKKKIHAAFDETDETKKEEVHANATELLKKHNYEVQEHKVKTDDGYYLTMFRIQPKEDNDSKADKKRPVVLLMHGLLGSADDWLLMGPKKSLAYMLTDAGYDVWLGNTRGNKYSRWHASKHESHPDFWKFSMDEIALHDLPAMIDHALKTSEQEKLHYVGHSQGNKVFFALAATRPEYREKVATMHALAPMAYMTNVRSPFLKMIAPNSKFYDRLHDELGHGEFKPSKELINIVGGSMCQKEIGCKHVCSNVNFIMNGVDTAGMDYDLLPSIVGHLPAGTSTRNIKQQGQAVASHEFRKYDYGTATNKKIYGQRQPPKYDMTEVKVPVSLYYSEEDWLAHPKDVERLHKELPDVRDHYKVPEKHFSHMDFQFSKKAPEAVYKRLIESIKKN